MRAGRALCSDVAFGLDPMAANTIGLSREADKVHAGRVVDCTYSKPGSRPPLGNGYGYNCQADQYPLTVTFSGSCEPTVKTTTPPTDVKLNEPEVTPGSVQDPSGP